MGMYDTIINECPLLECTEKEFQTKDFENMLFTYIITKEGRLIERSHSLDVVPEEERHYYGRPEWDESPILQMVGSMKEVDIKEKDMNFHGDIRMYTSKGDDWLEYEVRFTEGNVTRVKEIHNHP
ncbi:MAG: hypothetical protein DRQ47_08445 [Gammaproteobacteria bacterium]|nr:MAG: hypothetical protein DRQ47_08445 [Gammaproteobacteria bacterium]